MSTCPCGSTKPYSTCCEPIIKGTLPGPTAESVMRARYSAYVKAEIEFITQTQKSENADLEATKKWSEESTWLGLEIVKTEKGLEADETGVVEFIASYINKGLKLNHHEVSEFKKENGKWMYAKGQVIPTQVVRTEPKLGRNDPCHCGSGKKFKQCHGKVA